MNNYALGALLGALVLILILAAAFGFFVLFLKYSAQAKAKQAPEYEMKDSTLLENGRPIGRVEGCSNEIGQPRYRIILRGVKLTGENDEAPYADLDLARLVLLDQASDGALPIASPTKPAPVWKPEPVSYWWDNAGAYHDSAGKMWGCVEPSYKRAKKDAEPIIDYWRVFSFDDEGAKGELRPGQKYIDQVTARAALAEWVKKYVSVTMAPLEAFLHTSQAGDSADRQDDDLFTRDRPAWNTRHGRPVHEGLTQDQIDDIHDI